ncbi:Ty3/gypsy retrotransposon protein [Trifolium pratense]|uniref:Ty3/gypsy retrotransposon protein n=1 Tax=Trifolium pratense TaxID=57577 RepID=A0A2K3MQA8_TRIPR|nr:Ty3/gypsy retrotransposon protein [Trifolium pratense]
MASSNEMKETPPHKHIQEEMQLFQAKILERMESLEASSDAKFDKLFAAMDVLITQSPQKQPHGTNVHEWIFRAEQFFEYYDTPDLDRLTIASVHLDKDVVPWYQMVQRTHPFQSWIEFTRALELSFGPSVYDCPRATLFKLKQIGTVAEYYLKFTTLANRVYGLSNDALIDCFVSGLHDDIRRDVLIHTPSSLVKAFSLAKVYEEKYTSTTNQKRLNTTNYSTNKPLNKPEILTRDSAPILNTPPTRPMSQFQKNPNIKRISPAERQVRRDKGLCYWCDEKFSFTHKCPNRQLMLVQYDDDEDKLFDEMTQPPDITTNSHDTNPPEHHLSLNAMKGTSNMGVLRFEGSIEHIRVQILIDGGSSDNFLQPRIAKFLRLPIEPGPQFNVLVGNGEVMTAEGVIQKLPLEIQGHMLEVPVFLLPVAGADVILGASWLATLGPHVADYASLTLKFFLRDKFVTLTGQAVTRPIPAQFHHFKRLAKTDVIAECFTIQCLKPHEEEDIFKELPTNIEPELAILLHTYKSIFKAPTALPPHRSHNHTIPLMEGTTPVKVKPYRYPHSQKEQIELMIQEMLQQGIIQNSTSPFSSPIILVKKKDGTWRFCTDYRALNAITVKDCFPIPTVDELLDELCGAKYFSKLDLRSGYHQILLQPEDRHKTAFRTHQGHYECTDWQEHLKHVEGVLRVLQDNTLYVKMSKCSFGVTEIEYLGHVVTGQGVSMDKDKVQAVLNWPTPLNVKQLRGFLGLTGYYRRFIQVYAKIASPLTDLLKKEAYMWNDRAEQAFQQLKVAMTTAPVLALPNFKHPFILETDASGIGIGAVLHQQGHPIAYFSKKLNGSKESEKLDGAITPNTYQQQWLHKFLGYDFIIEYKPGKENIAADALSRVMTLAWSEPKCLFIEQVLFEFHTSPIGGHAGITRTIARIKSQFYWPGMKQDITDYVQKCVVCQQAKTINTSPAGLLQPLPIPAQVWEDIAMDFITGLPPSYGNTTIMVIVDRLTKYAHFIAMKSDYSSKSVAEAFMHNIVKLHGMPKSIVSDRDKVFTSAFWQQLLKLQGTSLAMSSAYHPQSDGQTEVLNKVLELFLRCFTFNNPKSWSKVMSWAEYWYNTAFQTSIGMTPFKALYGREPPYLIKYEAQEIDSPALQDELKGRDKILQQLKSNLERAQQYMKHQADKHRKDVKFQIGELVLVRLQPYRQQSVALRKNQKLGMRYFGPFEIIDCIGKVAYKLKLPDNAKIHPVFHVSQLKPFKGTTDEQYLPLPLTMTDIGPIIQPAAVLQARTIMKGTQKVHQILVQWEQNSKEEATWEV